MGFCGVTTAVFISISHLFSQCYFSWSNLKEALCNSVSTLNCISSSVSPTFYKTSHISIDYNIANNSRSNKYMTVNLSVCLSLSSWTMPKWQLIHETIISSWIKLQVFPRKTTRKWPLYCASFVPHVITPIWVLMSLGRALNPQDYKRRTSLWQ